MVRMLHIWKLLKWYEFVSISLIMIVKKITLSLVEYSTLECGIFKKFEKTIIKVN